MQKDELAAFFSEFYNYARWVQEDDRLSHKSTDISTIADKIKGIAKKSLGDGVSGGGKHLATEMSFTLQKSSFVVGAQNKSGDMFNALRVSVFEVPRVIRTDG